MLARLSARLPPLWSVVALFVGLTLPQALLGLPVAAAAVGPLPALVVILITGTLMTIAAAAEGEALVRDVAAGVSLVGLVVTVILARRAGSFHGSPRPGVTRPDS